MRFQNLGLEVSGMRTGRMSSSKPNLQNLRLFIHDELAQEIIDAFAPVEAFNIDCD